MAAESCTLPAVIAWVPEMVTVALSGFEIWAAALGLLRATLNMRTPWYATGVSRATVMAFDVASFSAPCSVPVAVE